MKRTFVTVVVSMIVVAAAVGYTFSKGSPPSPKVSAEEFFVSSYAGYVAGYVNETIPLHIYLINADNADFSGTVGVRNLPPCLDSEGISIMRYSFSERENSFMISIALRLKEPGHCVMSGAYLEVREGDSLKRAPLGTVEFEIMKPSGEESLEISTYVEASTGSTPSMPRLIYTVSNPFDEPVEILNVTFDVPGLRVENFEPREIPPGGEANLTVTLTNTDRLNVLYIIKPLIVYRMGGKTYSMPAQPYYHITLPEGADQ